MSAFEPVDTVEAPFEPGPVELPVANHAAPEPVPESAPESSDASLTMHEAKHELDDLLRRLVEAGGSDLHVTAGAPPAIRKDGDLVHMPGQPNLTPADTEVMLRTILTDKQWEQFATTNELDIAYTLAGISRFRVNVFRQRGAVAAVLRTIPYNIRSLGELGLPSSVEAFAHLPRGLVLVTGPTGSGKSTTLASLLDVANQARAAHIVTIEDPIEYLHSHRRSIVNQREVGNDTESFTTALKHVLRQDPDIILVGELRDLETTSVAVTAAETGHLVLATLHTQSAAQTIDRLIDIYPPHQQQQIRAQLSNCLQGVVTQALAPRADGTGRAIICEIMMASSAIRNLIREGKVHQIPSFLQSSSEQGMISFDQHLAQRYAEHIISQQTAMELAHDPAEFKRLARI